MDVRSEARIEPERELDTRRLVVHAHPHQHIVHELDDGREWMHWTTHHDHEHEHVALFGEDEPSGIPADGHLHDAHVHDHDRRADF
jgi:hypothetical protein